MSQIKCPCCFGAGTIEAGPPIPLPILQVKIYEVVRIQKHGITNADLVTKVYENHADGGPDFAAVSVRVMIKRINDKIIPCGQRIRATNKGMGAILYLERLNG